jgi:hypothetical protein
MEENAFIETKQFVPDFSSSESPTHQRVQINAPTFFSNKLQIDTLPHYTFRQRSIDIELTSKLYKAVGSREVQVFATCWLVNKTAFNLSVYKNDIVSLAPNSTGIYHKCNNKIWL